MSHVHEMTSDSQEPDEDLDVIYLDAMSLGKAPPGMLQLILMVNL